MPMCNTPDGERANGVARYYREALGGLGRAIEHLKQANVDFAGHLGDVSTHYAPALSPSSASPVALSSFSPWAGQTFVMQL